MPQPRRWTPAAWTEPLSRTQQALELRDDLEQVAHQSDVGDLEDRRFAVLVDGHDGACVLDARQMLNGPGDADGDVHLRRDDLARLADLHFIRRITGIDGGARGAHGRADFVREAEQQLEVFRTAEGAAARYDAGGRLQVRTIGRTALGSDIAGVRGQRNVHGLG